jgi:hypothetical protein
LGPVFIVIIAVPGIALLVGAIVIMNIMLVRRYRALPRKSASEKRSARGKPTY